MDDLLYLQHTTTFDNLFRILNSGKLYTGVDMWFNNVISEGGLTIGSWYPGSKPDQYPGVYMKLIHKNLINTENVDYFSKDDVQLIFCISLLQRQDFHYNYEDSNGFFNENITSFNIPELQDNIKKRNINHLNEVVFHHSVSLKYLKEVWVKNKKVYNRLKSEFDKLSVNIPIRITQKYLDITYTCDNLINAKTPNNCYFFDHFGRFELKSDGYPYNIEWYRTMAKKCGLTDIDELTPELIEDLLEQNLILSEDITNDEIKEYLRSKGVSDDNIENLSDRQLDEIKDINIVGLNFLKNYSKLDGGKRKKSRERKSKSKRRKSGTRKSKRKSVSRKYCLTTSPRKMGFSQKASCKAQGLLKRTSKKNKGKYLVSPKYRKRRSRRSRRSRK